MRRVDLLLPTLNLFSFERYMKKELSKAFAIHGIATKSVVFDQREALDYFSNLSDDPPLFTLSFSETLSLKHPEIPHFYWEYRSVAESLHLLKSPLNSLGCCCRNTVLACKKYGLKPTFLLPAAPLPSLSISERPYDVVLFDDLVDPDCLEKTWEELYPPEFTDILRSVVQKCLETPSQHPLEVILSLNLEQANLNDLLYLTEEYLKAKRIHALLQTFKSAHIHVFGEHIGNNWYARLKNSNEISLHSTLPYAQPYNDYFEILKMSKILIRDPLPYSDGCDEWIFPAISHGCLPLTLKAPYLEEELGDHIPLAQNEEELQKNVYTLLEDPSKRMIHLQSAQKNVLKNHTFEKRVSQLLEIMKCG
jgi:hypothetical protein